MVSHFGIYRRGEGPDGYSVRLRREEFVNPGNSEEAGVGVDILPFTIYFFDRGEDGRGRIRAAASPVPRSDPLPRPDPAYQE